MTPHTPVTHNPNKDKTACSPVGSTMRLCVWSYKVSIILYAAVDQINGEI